MLNRIDLLKMKQSSHKITMLTAYDYPSAKLAEQAGIDMILVGDSLGMVVLGYDSTIQVTMEDMIHHGKAVKRGASNTFIVVDMPFMSYHISKEESLRNAKRLFQETGAQAVKIEGASRDNLELIHSLSEAGIPVIAHLGLTPQSVHILGGYKVQGKDKEAAAKLLHEAKEVTTHGAIALVLECVPKELAERITNEINIPTIGIGAGKHCDGQVLVYHDIVNYGVNRLPKFVKKYGDFNELGQHSIENYIKEVKASAFPSDEHAFLLKDNGILPDN